MNEIIKKYIEENLSINIKEVSYGFNGKSMIFELKFGNKVISSDSFSIKRDDG